MCCLDACLCVFFRVTLLELLFAQLKEEDSEECSIPPSVARFLASSFQKGCGAVLTLATGSASSDEVQTDNLDLRGRRTITSFPLYLTCASLLLGAIPCRSCRRHWQWSVCWTCYVRWPQTASSLCFYRTILTFWWPLLVNENTLTQPLWLEGVRQI